MHKEHDTHRKTFKFKNSLRIRYEYTKPYLRKFRTLRSKLMKKNKDPEKDYNCIFDNCDKIFPNYTRWMLHYRVHVIKLFIFLIFLA